MVVAWARVCQPRVGLKVSTRKRSMRWPSGMYSCNRMRLKVTGLSKARVSVGVRQLSGTAQ